MVSNGEIPLTIVDSDIASLNKTYYKDLDVSLQLSFSQQSSWAVSSKAAPFNVNLSPGIFVLLIGLYDIRRRISTNRPKFLCFHQHLRIVQDFCHWLYSQHFELPTFSTLYFVFRTCKNHKI
jgi:hypothetical protein